MKFFNTRVLPMFICVIGFIFLYIFTFTDNIFLMLTSLIPTVIIVTGPLWASWSSKFERLYEENKDE